MSEGLRRMFKLTHPINRDGAQTCLIINLCAWPGLGSTLAGRKAGWAQMALSVGGLLAVASSLFQFMAMIWEETRYPNWHDRFVWLAIGGASAFAGSWIWSLFTSLSIRKHAVPTPPKRRPGEPPPLR